MEIQFDTKKADANERKHKVSFHEAASVLFDPMAYAYEDNDTYQEPRWLLLGMSDKQRLLVVVYTLRENEIIRLISARKATAKEVSQYAR